MNNKIPDVNNVFTQLDAALALLARAKGSLPDPEYFHKSTESVRTLRLDGGFYQIVITQEEKEEQK